MKLREEADYLTTASCTEDNAKKAIFDAEQFFSLAATLTEEGPE
jgi:uncharacterized protein (UPF0332 family)